MTVLLVNRTRVCHGRAQIPCHYFWLVFWQLLSKKCWTPKGLVDLYVLVFIQIGSRRVWVSSCTPHPDAAWVAQQARNVCMHFAEEEHKPTFVTHDADTKFTKQFDGIFEAEGIWVKKHVPVSPNLQAYVERFVQTIQQEALDHFVILGRRHLDHIIKSFVDYYHECRPHQGLGNVPPNGSLPGEEDEIVKAADVVCRERLGGLLKHYERRAA